MYTVESDQVGVIMQINNFIIYKYVTVREIQLYIQTHFYGMF